MFTIEENIPVMGYEYNSACDAIKKMKVGDSVLIDNDSALEAFIMAAKNMAVKCAQKVESNSVRVWIVGKPASVDDKIMKVLADYPNGIKKRDLMRCIRNANIEQINFTLNQLESQGKIKTEQRNSPGIPSYLIKPVLK